MTTEQQINDLGPWISKFTIDGISTGGWFDVLADVRAIRWLNLLKNPVRVVECGPLEGGHTALIAQHPHVSGVVGLESREANLKKCRFTHDSMGITNSEFHQCDLDQQPISQFGKFDAMWCSGVLYHLDRPDRFLQRLDVPDLFLGTHYSKESIDTYEGMRGRWYQEHGLADVLSGMSDRSFWLTLGNIQAILADAGYEIYELITSDSQNGPWVDLMAHRKPA